MKVIPLVTVQSDDKDGKHSYTPAGEVVDLAKPIAQDLLDRGFARLPNDEAAAPVDAPSVTSEAGPQITPIA